MMKIIISTFFLVFLAELGDKTQITTMLLSAQSNSKLGILIGSSLALVCSSIAGVFLGSFINKYIPESIIQSSAGIAFLIIGILMLLHKI